MDFSTQIKNFINTGTLVPQIDDGGNVYLNGSSSNFNQNYVSIPLQVSYYNTSSIESYYPIEFTEFISNNRSTTTPTITDLMSQISNLQAITSSLSTQLNDVILEQSSNSNSADIQASKQVILEFY